MEKVNSKKKELENQVKNASDALSSMVETYKSQGKTILVVGGILVAAYAITQLFDDTEEDTIEKKDPSIFGGAITGLATTIALNFAKQKLMAYLENTSDNAS